MQETRNHYSELDFCILSNFFGMPHIEQYIREQHHPNFAQRGGNLRKRTVVASIVCGLAVTGWAVTSSSTLSRAQEAVSFTKDIQPILQDSCLKCHGEAMQ